MPHSRYLKTALQAVKKAESIINSYYSDGIKVTIKSDQSPVTIADQKSESVIREIINNNYPNHSILGEEKGRSKKNSSFTWIIDPIDGTKNFMRQIPLFATQIALMKDSKIILGVSNAPALGELMYAEKGKGAFLNNKKINVSSIDKISKSYMSYGGIGCFDKINLMDVLLKLDQDTLAHRGIGDFWSYHLLAQGKIDIMLEAKVKIWDIAALSLIVKEAGGKITNLSGSPIDENTTSIIATNGRLHESITKYFK